MMIAKNKQRRVNPAMLVYKDVYIWKYDSAIWTIPPWLLDKVERTVQDDDNDIATWYVQTTDYYTEPLQDGDAVCLTHSGDIEVVGEDYQWL